MANNFRIIAGGQTGVDRGALDAALEAGLPCGGWCPAGRLDENGRIPDKYPLSEMLRGGALDRTIQNILKSDATAIIYFDKPRGGTEQTLLHCILLGRPYQLIDAVVLTAPAAASLTAVMIRSLNIGVLNVAGPRQSEAGEAYDYAREYVSELMKSLPGEPIGR